jgi:capreomycidine synthase
VRLAAAGLEDWLRERYFAATIDISSSGVQSYSMGELRAKTGIDQREIDELVFDDGYSLGTPAVRAAIAQRWGGGPPDKVMTTVGSGEAISLVLMALLRPGDEVVVVRPGYHLLTEFALAQGCVVRDWQLDPALGWVASLDQLAELVTPRTRAIIANFPHNPTGASISELDLITLIHQAERVGAYLLWDGAFTDLSYDTEPLPEVSTRYQRGISFGTFSKAFGLPGLRFGWCIAPTDVLADCVRIRDYTTLHVSPLNELLALRVLEHADAFIGPRLAQARANREILRQWAEECVDHVSLTVPVGGAAAFPRLVGLRDAGGFCEELFQRYGVLVIPGACFGSPAHVRIGFGGATGQLVAGLERLSDALARRTTSRQTISL